MSTRYLNSTPEDWEAPPSPPSATPAPEAMSLREQWEAVEYEAELRDNAARMAEKTLEGLDGDGYVPGAAEETWSRSATISRHRATRLSAAAATLRKHEELVTVLTTPVLGDQGDTRDFQLDLLRIGWPALHALLSRLAEPGAENTEKR